MELVAGKLLLESFEYSPVFQLSLLFRLRLVDRSAPCLGCSCSAQGFRCLRVTVQLHLSVDSLTQVVLAFSV